jgi:integration host factor subunit alpha
VTLTKEHIVKNLASIGRGTVFGKKESFDLVESLLEIIKKTLENGEDVLISGFGKFCVNEKKERRGRNPQTGEKLTLRSRRTITFQCSGKLRDKINGKGKPPWYR